MATRSRAEQETILRWDQDERVLYLFTAYPSNAEKWRRLGYAVRVVSTADGEPCAWEARGPVSAVKLRRVKDGQIIKRAPRTYATSPFKPKNPAVQRGSDESTPPGQAQTAPTDPDPANPRVQRGADE